MLAEIARRGRDPRAIVESLLHRLADLTRASYQMETGGDAAQSATLHETAARIGRENIVRLRGDLSEAHKVIRDITLPRLWLESELLRIAVAPQVAPKQAEAPPAPRPAPPKAPVQEKPSALEAAANLVSEKPAAPTIKPSSEEKRPVEVPKIEHESQGPGSTPVKEPQDVWAAVLECVNDRYQGKAVALKLIGSKVKSLDENTLNVTLLRQMDVDWFNETPQRIGHLNKILHECGGHGWSVKVSADPKLPKIDEPVSVELAAEGERLDQIAREVFGS
jgi:DNA polymerase-3 subunit gamma/tau